MTTPPPPSTTSYVLATAILALAAGYFIGQASSIGLFSSPSSPPSSSTNTKKKNGSSKTKSWPNSYDVAIHPDSSDEELMRHVRREGVQVVEDSEAESGEEEEEARDGEGDEEGEEEERGGELKGFEGNRDEECKLVLVVRTDLGMGKGKIAAQASHATLACYRRLLSHSHFSSPPTSLLKRWESTGQAKIALQVPSEDQLDELHAKALSLGLCAQVVRDAGRTQIAEGTKTVLGVGPGPRSVVDGVTGGLRLL